MTGDLLLSDGSVARLTGLVNVAADAAAIAGLLCDAGGQAGSSGLRNPASRPDRWGRDAVIVSMRGLDPPDLADALLQAGLARVQAKDAPRDCLNRFLQSEALARRARVGFWARAETALLDAADGAVVAQRAGTFAVMEGRVTHVGRTRRDAPRS